MYFPTYKSDILKKFLAPNYHLSKVLRGVKIDILMSPLLNNLSHIKKCHLQSTHCMTLQLSFHGQWKKRKMEPNIPH